jgi:hypothetical protein
MTVLTLTLVDEGLTGVQAPAVEQ